MPAYEDIQKAKLLIVAILRESGGSFTGKTRLYKAFYVAHLYHYQKQTGVLSDYPVVRMPRGPAIDDGDNLLNSLVQEGLIHIGKRMNGPYVEEVYTLIGQASALADHEWASVRDAVQWIADKTATQLSEWTHEYSNTWEDTPNGRVMNIYADLLDEAEYQQMKQRHQQAKGIVDAVFG